MDGNLTGKTVAFMVAAGFNQTEFTELQRAMVKAGARLLTIAPEQGVVNGWQPADNSWGHTYPVDQILGETLAADLDILVIPGGERSMAKLSQSLHARRILTHAVDGMMPVVLFDSAPTLLPEGTATGENVMTVTDLSAESWVEDAVSHMAHDFMGEDMRAAA